MVVGRLVGMAEGRLFGMAVVNGCGRLVGIAVVNGCREIGWNGCSEWLLGDWLEWL